MAPKSEVYSAMPADMETTVCLKIGVSLLAGVVFGGVSYEIGNSVRIRLKDNGLIRFSRASGCIIDTCSLVFR